MLSAFGDFEVCFLQLFCPFDLFFLSLSILSVFFIYLAAVNCLLLVFLLLDVLLLQLRKNFPLAVR